MPSRSPLPSTAARLLPGLILALLLAACTPKQPPAVYQLGDFEVFALGDYQGTRPLKELAKSGDFGLGTLHGLDGEMVVVDGVFYRADGQCNLTRPSMDALSPFANLVTFKAQGREAVKDMPHMAALTQWLDARLPKGGFAAARVDAGFKSLTIRSVPGYAQPWPHLTDALKTQHVKTIANARGTLVALRGPARPGGGWVAGWHVHFVSEDRTLGGHVLGFEGLEGQAAWMSLERLVLELPTQKP
ncbi:Alpha-acetolactate decarboxylase [Fundidesulfovibrio magnetotacticus]|uniref:Alpha-acetolactate decarboxylase n=1 Tax=Fundidesulfovibrio magnetotacticus TaxID=2730080 RepID=A0A6V8LV20_9BACT|nr:acetolactate decarboxylase [Fundidesulfovibrio magnetotacticus]GFK93959.1 Alpha-acetolactate decarboxylase [Fundidesulfovibrio magnetotacticus]